MFNSFFHVLPVISAKKAKGEIVRKGIHLLVALVPPIAAINRPATILLLILGIFFYSILDLLTLKGYKIPVFYKIITAASRERDAGKFTFGPVTLALGAAVTLAIFPPPVASVAIYALAFGDGFASLIGRIFGMTRPAILNGKSVEGSLACFTAVYISALTASCGWTAAFFIALTATFIEMLPLKDWDNIIIPLSTGCAAFFLMI
ncbi:MAG: phosphatidate cytidylyltransferase [Spirochaetaceae bacterium]|nr:phosphatidate cytidylyltransferase [Spirochaetaceae bacterium]